MGKVRKKMAGGVRTLKYCAAATFYKAFSINDPMRRLYRYIGNTLGSAMRRRRGLSPEHIRRAETILDECRRHDAVVDGSRLLEIGTGWVHWESTMLRLHYDVRIDLFDVWDNRQLAPYEEYVSQFGKKRDRALFQSRKALRRASGVIRSIVGARSLAVISRWH